MPSANHVWAFSLFKEIVKKQVLERQAPALTRFNEMERWVGRWLVGSRDLADYLRAWGKERVFGEADHHLAVGRNHDVTDVIEAALPRQLFLGHGLDIGEDHLKVRRNRPAVAFRQQVLHDQPAGAKH